MEVSCKTCKNKDLSLDKEPCASCWIDDGFLKLWQPQNQPEEKQLKTCNECIHFAKSWSACYKPRPQHADKEFNIERNVSVPTWVAELEKSCFKSKTKPQEETDTWYYNVYLSKSVYGYTPTVRIINYEDCNKLENFILISTKKIEVPRGTDIKEVYKLLSKDSTND